MSTTSHRYRRGGGTIPWEDELWVLLFEEYRLDRFCEFLKRGDLEELMDRADEGRGLIMYDALKGLDLVRDRMLELLGSDQVWVHPLAASVLESIAKRSGLVFKLAMSDAPIRTCLEGLSSANAMVRKSCAKVVAYLSAREDFHDLFTDEVLDALVEAFNGDEPVLVEQSGVALGMLAYHGRARKLVDGGVVERALEVLGDADGEDVQLTVSYLMAAIAFRMEDVSCFNQAQVAKLVRIMETTSPVSRMNLTSVLMSLAEKGNRDVLVTEGVPEMLTGMFDDADHRTRANIVSFYRHMVQKGNVQDALDAGFLRLLVQGVGMDNEALRANCAGGFGDLAELGGAELLVREGHIPLMVDLAEDRVDGVRLGATYTLRQVAAKYSGRALEEEGALPVLVKAIEDPISDVRKNAIEALEAIAGATEDPEG